MKVLLGHEWLDARMGSEKVFEVFLRLFPDADVVTLWANTAWRTELRDRKFTALLGQPPQRRPELVKAATLPAMPFIWQLVDTASYDVVLTSQHAFAHTLGAIQRAPVNLTYVHSTARYVWSPEIDKRTTTRGLEPARAVLRALDRRLARHHTSVASNSEAVRTRVLQHWGVDSKVLHPPVDVRYMKPRIDHEGQVPYLVGAGRWVTYKRPDLVIDVGESLGMPVRLLGSGPMGDVLRRKATISKVPVDILESPSDKLFRKTLRDAACLVQPATEDFGIVTVEALAVGTPVASLGAGGALDIVKEGINGAMADGQTIEALGAAVRRALEVDRQACIASAQRFSTSAFEVALKEWVLDSLNKAEPSS